MREHYWRQRTKARLFLDVDGVLNNHEAFETQGTMMALDNTCLNILRDLVYETEAGIILSSYWRFNRVGMDYLKFRLSEKGLALDGTTQTKHAAGIERYQEIDNHIRNNEWQNVPCFALDDNKNILQCELAKPFITKFSTGLTLDVAHDIIVWLTEHRLGTEGMEEKSIRFE